MLFPCKIIRCSSLTCCSCNLLWTVTQIQATNITLLWYFVWSLHVILLSYLIYLFNKLCLMFSAYGHGVSHLFLSWQGWITLPVLPMRLHSNIRSAGSIIKYYNLSLLEFFKFKVNFLVGLDWGIGYSSTFQQTCFKLSKPSAETKHVCFLMQTMEKQNHRPRKKRCSAEKSHKPQQTSS